MVLPPNPAPSSGKGQTFLFRFDKISVANRDPLARECTGICVLDDEPRRTCAGEAITIVITLQSTSTNPQQQDPLCRGQDILSWVVHTVCANAKLHGAGTRFLCAETPDLALCRVADATQYLFAKGVGRVVGDCVLLLGFLCLPANITWEGVG